MSDYCKGQTMIGCVVTCAWCGESQWNREAAMRHGPTCSQSPGYALRQAVIALQAHPCVTDSCDHHDSVCADILRNAIEALPVAPTPTDPPLAVAV